MNSIQWPLHPTMFAGTVANTWLFNEIQSDFEWGVFFALFLCASVLCISNFFFLQRQKITRRQLESTRTFRIMQAQRELAIFRFNPKARIIGNAFFKVVGVVIIYAFQSSRYPAAIALGSFFALVYLVVNFKILFKAISNPRSVFNRKHVWYRKSEEFFRQRMLFELLRKFLYFVTCFAFLTYGFHRLEFADFNEKESSGLFLEHFRMNLSGMTSLGTANLSPANTVAQIIESVRTITVVCIIAVFISIAGSNVGYEEFRRKTGHKFKPAAPENDATIEELRSVIEGYLEQKFSIPRGKMTANPTFKRMGVDSIDVAALIAHLEHRLEIAALGPEEIKACKTVSDMANVLGAKLRPRPETVHPPKAYAAE